MQNLSHEQKKALLALLVGAATIGFSPILVRLSDVSPLASAFYRVALAVPLIWFVAHRAGADLLRTFSPKLLLPGILFAGDLALWHLSINYTYVANATLLANAAPVFVTLGAWLILRESITRQFITGLLVAIAGAIFLLAESLQINMQNLLGDMLGIGTAVFYGAYLLSMRYLRRHYSTIALMWWSSLVTALCLLPIALIGSETVVPATWQGWLILVCLAWFAHTGGQGLITYALAHLPAAFSSVTLLVQPLVAGLLAWMIFNEMLSWLQMFGFVITMSGIYLCKRAA